jgi:hypothetical protein
MPWWQEDVLSVKRLVIRLNNPVIYFLISTEIRTSHSSIHPSFLLSCTPAFQEVRPSIHPPTHRTIHSTNQTYKLTQLFIYAWRVYSTLKPSILWVPGGYFPAGKAVAAWSWPLTSTWCQGQEWWSHSSTLPYVFMARCLINVPQGQLCLFTLVSLFWKNKGRVIRSPCCLSVYSSVSVHLSVSSLIF